MKRLYRSCKYLVSCLKMCFDWRNLLQHFPFDLPFKCFGFLFIFFYITSSVNSNITMDTKICFQYLRESLSVKSRWQHQNQLHICRYFSWSAKKNNVFLQNIAQNMNVDCTDVLYCRSHLPDRIPFRALYSIRWDLRGSSHRFCVIEQNIEK